MRHGPFGRAGRPGAPILVLVAVLTFLVIAACAQAAITRKKPARADFPRAFARRGCTEEDAPAIEIYLTQILFSGVGEPKTPFIRIEISALPDETIGATALKLIPLRRDPSARQRIVRALLVEAGREPVWLSGTVTLVEAVPGGRISGRFDVMTSSRKRFAGAFNSPYPAGSAFCG